METHELHMIVKFESEKGWDAANGVAMDIGKVVMNHPNVLEADGSVDPSITEGRVKVHMVLT